MAGKNQALGGADETKLFPLSDNPTWTNIQVEGKDPRDQLKTLK